jgi:hypothetical protein
LLQVVNFRETLKCIAKVVVGLDVSLDHPPNVGSMHDWFAACLIQKVARGKLHRKRVAERLAKQATLGFGGVRVPARVVLSVHCWCTVDAHPPSPQTPRALVAW